MKNIKAKRKPAKSKRVSKPKAKATSRPKVKAASRPEPVLLTELTPLSKVKASYRTANRGGSRAINLLVLAASIIAMAAALLFAEKSQSEIVRPITSLTQAKLIKPTVSRTQAKLIELKAGPSLAPVKHPVLPIVIAVIDSGYDNAYAERLNLCKHVKHRVYTTGTGMRDVDGHGTNVGGLIVAKANASKSDYCLAFYKVFDGKKKNGRAEQRIADAVSQAVADGAAIINLSLSGRGAYPVEYEALREAVFSDAWIVVAAGNEGLNLDKGCSVFPVCYPLMMYRIGNGKLVSIVPDKAKKKALVTVMRHRSSNYGSMIQNWIPGCDTESVNGKMCGSSQSTAIASGLLIEQAIAKQLAKEKARKSGVGK